MGHPKKHRKKFDRPKRPWDKERINSEKKIMQDFGLRRKKEIWRAETTLRNFRQRARELLASRDPRKEKEIFDRLRRMGLVKEDAKLEDILEIKLEDILSRRLQSIVYKKGLANSPRHARQLIVHGHVTVESRRVVWPGYLVKSGSEEEIGLKQSKLGELQ